MCFPNVYGIDMPAAHELIVTGAPVAQIQELIGADWLLFQDLGDLIECAREGNPELDRFDTSVFDGRYVTGDVDERYLRDLEQARNDASRSVQLRRARRERRPRTSQWTLSAYRSSLPPSAPMTAAARRPLPPLPPTSSIERVHIIGICGTAMGTLAAMFAERGLRVRGSDAMAYPPMSTWLEERGLVIQSGYAAEHIAADTQLVVVGNVSRVDNPEAVAAREARAADGEPPRGAAALL